MQWKQYQIQHYQLFNTRGIAYVRDIIAILWLTEYVEGIWYNKNLVICWKLYVDYINIYLWFKYDLDRSTLHPKFESTGVRAHDLQIIDTTFHVPQTLVLTAEPSGTSCRNHFQLPFNLHGRVFFVRNCKNTREQQNMKSVNNTYCDHTDTTAYNYNHIYSINMWKQKTDYIPCVFKVHGKFLRMMLCSDNMTVNCKVCENDWDSHVASVTWSVLSWSRGHEFEPGSGWTWGS